MSVSFDPLLPPVVLAVVVVVYTALAIRFYRRIRPIVTTETWRLLLIGKSVAIVLLTALLLNPYWIRTIPDTRAFRVILLADATGSMKTADCANDRTRLEILHGELVGPDAQLRQRLAAKYDNLRTYVFANDQPRELGPNGDFDVLPGDTDLDGVLSAIHATDSSDTGIGAVLLMTDGIDNVGSPMQEAAAHFKKSGIPVHVIGIGDSRARRDVGITWRSTPRETPRGQSFNMSATVKRNFDGDYDNTVVLYEDGREIARKAVEFTGDAQTQQVEFEHTAYTSGLKTYKVKMEGSDDEENALNNIDFAGVSVRDPDRFRVLYFSGSLDYQYRYLRRLAEDQERLSVDAIIRTGEDHWFSHGVTDVQAPTPDSPGTPEGDAATAAAESAESADSPTDAAKDALGIRTTFDDETAVEGFPEPEQLNEYDGLIIHLSGLYILSEEDRKNLRRFIDERGGGVLFCGDAPEIPADVQEMLPIEMLPQAPTLADPAAIQFPYSRMFTGKRMTPVKELEGRLGVPAASLIYRVTNEQVKPGASVAASVKGPGWPVLTGHNYGAGKVAWLNVTDTWKWVMKAEKGADDHAAFWGYTIAWLSSSSRNRLTIRPRPSKFAVGTEQTIKLDLLTSRYQPDNAAKIECIAIGPDGSDENLQFIPSPSQDGRYLGRFIPPTPGEYRLRFKAETADGEFLEQVVDYVVVDQSAESQPAPLAEPQLQNLTRATGGDYWRYTDANKIDELRLNKAVIQKTEQRWLRDRWWMLAFVAVGILPDWYFRRKTGLR